MSQILSQIPRQLLQQQQRLTPQLIQAMDILQLNAMALESRIEQERDANPALEVANPDDEFAGGETTDAEDTGPAVDERTLRVSDNGAEDFNRLDTLVREYDWIDDDLGYRSAGSRARGEEASLSKLEAMANTAARPLGLHDHLMRQWGLVEGPDRQRRLGMLIIEALDENGRLSTPLADLGAEAKPPADEVELEAALRAVQQLEPAGVAARSLQESLLLQLAALPGENSLERRIIGEHFEDLQKNRLPQIARALGVELGEVKGALEAIAQLSLHPGSEMSEARTPALVPDVIVDYDEDADRYTARLARNNQRELRISPEFRELLERSRNDRATRDFVKQKIEAANAIIDAVRYRRERLLQVAQAVVDAQREFLDKGPQYLRVLRMSDLAERFGCDPSTISRTVDEKYMQTPRGLYPLRQFFTGGAERDDGDALGWASIRAKAQEIIAREDKREPLSDDEIVRRLRAEGIDIKRRTVAKYRAQLGILPARQRREY